MNSLFYFAGASLCTAGQISECPYYVHPFFYIVLAIIFISIIFLIRKYMVMQKNNNKNFKIWIVILALLLVIDIGYIVYKEIDGQKQWQQHMQNYYNCLSENEEKKDRIDLHGNLENSIKDSYLSCEF